MLCLKFLTWVGYMKGATTKICINSQDDLLDVWRKVESGKECVYSGRSLVTCDVPNTAETRKQPRKSQTYYSDSDSDSELPKGKKKVMKNIHV